MQSRALIGWSCFIRFKFNNDLLIFNRQSASRPNHSCSSQSKLLNALFNFNLFLNNRTKLIKYNNKKLIKYYLFNLI